MPVSIVPYSVTDDCACAAPAINASVAALLNFDFKAISGNGIAQFVGLTLCFLFRSDCKQKYHRNGVSGPTFRGSVGDTINAAYAYILADRLFAPEPLKLASVHKHLRSSVSSLAAQTTHANQQDNGGRDTGEWQ
jgi:hypothetical protein